MDSAPSVNAHEIFENVFAFFGSLTCEGFVLDLKGTVFERTGTNPDFLIGQKFSETVYWQSSEYTPGILEQSITEAAKGKKSKTLLDFRVNSQEKITIEFFLHPVIGSSSDVTHIFFCAHDVTEREREVEHYKTRSEQLLFAAENAEIGLWFWDLAEDKIFSTPKCNELFEVPAHDIITLQSFLDIVHPEDSARVAAELRDSQLNGKEYDTDYRVIYSDGTVHWISARGKTFLDREGTPKNMMGVVRKVTDRKIASEELSRVYARERKARDEAEEANRAKDFFLAVVSHELRSPLNAILGWTKILLTKQLDQETRRNALETIEKSARSQAKLIEDLIDSARVSSGKLRLEFRTINLFEIIKTVYNLQTPAAQTKKIKLQFSADRENIQVFGDPMRLQQVFTNLLSNALKFTNEGGTVQVNVQTLDESAKVTVTDDGQGIKPELLPVIFSQFQQGDEKTSRDRSGLGLGLSIVKILIEKHNGQVQAESDGVGKGSTFTVILPLCGTETDVSTEIRKSATPGKRLLNGVKILVVEDDQDSREVLQLFLEQSGAVVKSAESANKAMSLLRENPRELFDVIISDLAMPDVDGYSLIKQIRSLPKEKGSKIPALALSAFASNENKQKAISAGFQKYHTKPFDPDAIVQDILQIINNGAGGN